MRLGAKARPCGVSGELILGLTITGMLYRENGERLRITHLTDGKHMEKSLHYTGDAADVGLPKRHPSKIAIELAKRLGKDYDVVLSKDHIHIEYQPKSGVNLRGG